jgi:hypothetical protein
MIMAKNAGTRFQMDLVQLPEYNGFNYILRVVDHLSKYGFVHPLRKRTANKVGDALLCIISGSVGPKISKFGFVHPLRKRTANKVGDALLCIISGSVGPKILQSDNGGQVRL